MRVGRLPLLPLFAGANALLVLSYIGLIAVVMSYAALQVEFTQSVRSDEAAVAALEASYLNSLSIVTNTDYASLGYEKPLAQIFVPGAPKTAVNVR